MRGNFNYLKNYTFFVPGWGQIGVMFLWFIFGAALGNMVTLLFTAVTSQAVSQEYGMLLSYPLMFIPPMLYAASKSRANSVNSEGRSVDNSHFAPVGWPLLALALVPGMLAVGLVCDGINSFLPQMPEWLEEVLKSLTNGKFWVNFIAVSIYAPVFEEWLCRGVILRGLLARKTNPAAAIIASALIFALIHLNPWQAVPAFCIGCLMGYVYYRTGSLKLTMWMHFVNNSFALVVGHIDSLKDYDSWKDMLGASYWMYFVVGLIIIGLVILLVRRVELLRPEGNIDIEPSLFER